MTPEFQNRMAGYLLLRTAINEPESSIARHGVTRNQIMQIDPSQPRNEACDKAGNMLKEKRVFFVETFGAKLNSGEWTADKFMTATISEIQTDGDTATALLTFEGDRMQMYFARIEEEWRIALPINLLQAMGD